MPGPGLTPEGPGEAHRPGPIFRELMGLVLFPKYRYGKAEP